MTRNERLVWGAAALAAAGLGWCAMTGCGSDDEDQTPTTPGASLPIDDYAELERPMTCDPTPKPGVLAMRRYLLARFGEHAGAPQNIVRGCAQGDGQTSEHIEGRAWDLMTTSAAHGDSIVAALLATDDAGNPHALVRRFGIMYLIWNRHMWRAYSHPAGTRVWTPYSGPDPHTGHVHISLGWPGARGETTAYRSMENA